MTEESRFYEQEPTDGATDESLSGRIVHAREEQGLTTSQFARRLGVNTETLHDWESGRSEPRPNVLLRIAGMLNVSPTWLLTGKGESPPDTMLETEMMHIQATIERLRDLALTLADELSQLEERLETYQSHHN
jgi:transcriptional regulator with XRE-family HTH domain